MFIVGKIKDLWDKLKYWHRGAIIMFIPALIIFVLYTINSIRVGLNLGYTFLDIIKKANLFALLLPIIIIPLIYGSIMGIVYSFLLSKKKDDPRKRVLSILAFIIILLISLFLLFFLILYVIIGIVKPF